MSSKNLPNEEWFILESMKATTCNTKQMSETDETLRTEKKDDWYSLQRSDNEIGSNEMTEKISRPQDESVDFQICDNNREVTTAEDIKNTSFDAQGIDNFEDGSVQSMSFSNNHRLDLQESIDGEISNSSSPLDSRQNKNSIHKENKSVFSSINFDEHVQSNEWVNLTGASNMQDVERPEPLGSLESSAAQTSNVSNTNTTSSHKDINLMPANDSSSSTLSQAKSSKGTESDIPDLSYTYSIGSTLVDNQYLNKRVGPAQDVKLLSSSNDALSSLTSSSSEFSTSLSRSKISNETPVTKLLGPAYKQTEKFLKDLQDAKLSYTNKETTLGMSQLSSTLLSHKSDTSSILSKDESIQVGKSKLDISSNLSPTVRSVTKGPSMDLAEQDIASASLLDSDVIDKKYDNTLTTESILIVKEGSNDEQSEGELLISELSETMNKGKRQVSQSSISRSSSSRPTSGLEPIQEVKSPDKLTSVLTRHAPVDDSGTGESFDMKSTEHPISATSTPYADDINGSKSSQVLSLPTDTPGSINQMDETPKSKNSIKMIDDHPLDSNYKSYSKIFTNKSHSLEISGNSNEKFHSEPKSKSRSRTTLEYGESLNSNDNSSDNERSIVTNGQKTKSKESFEHRESFTKKTTSYVHKKRISYSSSIGSLSTPSSSSTLTNSEDDERVVPPLSIDRSDNTSIKTTSTDRRPLPKRSYVFPKDINISSSSSSRDQNLSKSSIKQERSVERSASKRKQRSFRDASLNELWESFERSYRDANSDRSPLIKKLEIVSNLLQESRQRSSNRRQMMELSDSSDTSTFCESHRSYDMKEGKNRARARHEKLNVTAPPPNVCPVCHRREIGTNFPTPIVSDSEKKKKKHETPLTLQMWTQTSPYIIDKNANVSADDVRKSHKDHTPSRSFLRQDTYTLKSPPKSTRTSRSHLKNDRRKEIPYTAWFQSVLSDVSDVVPLSKMPPLSSLYLNQRDRKIKQHEKGQIPNADLQEAFKRHKKHFIERSEQRIQGIKDGILKDKHGENATKKKSQLGNIGIEKRRISPGSERSRTSSREGAEKLTKSRTPITRHSPVQTPRNFQYMEELRMENLRQNRLKMKQYDLKNRERFLKRRAKTTLKRPRFVVIRH